MDPLRPYDITKMVVGAARVGIADADGPDAVGIPANIDDFHPMVADAGGAYPLETDWRDIGAATDGASYQHDRESDGIEIEQETGTIFDEITEITRGFGFNMAELDPTNLEFVEIAQSIETIAAAVGKSAQKAVGLGSYSSIPQYRMVLVGQRKLGAGAVVESAPSGRTRGRLVAVVLNRVALSEGVDLGFSKGSAASTDLAVTAFPDPAATDQDEAYGKWFLEEAGTIA